LGRAFVTYATLVILLPRYTVGYLDTPRNERLTMRGVLTDIAADAALLNCQF
jgi:hypothetical protein